MGSPDFRVGGRIFATLAAQAQGYGNLMLTPEKQAEFVAEAPAVFLPVAGGWGRNGATHLKLAAANEDLVYGALQTAWKLRIEKNRKAPKRRVPKSPGPTTKASGDEQALPRPNKVRSGHPGPVTRKKENIAGEDNTSVARRGRPAGSSRRLE